MKIKSKKQKYDSGSGSLFFMFYGSSEDEDKWGKLLTVKFGFRKIKSNIFVKP
ncbi:MAG: hypothetical protein WC119_00080 [Synergistaceae bacterium]